MAPDRSSLPTETGQMVSLLALGVLFVIAGLLFADWVRTRNSDPIARIRTDELVYEAEVRGFQGVEILNGLRWMEANCTSHDIAGMPFSGFERAMRKAKEEHQT